MKLPDFEPKRILVCGPRDWRPRLPVFCVVAGLKINFGDDITIIHGAAKGVDTLAGEAALSLGLDVEEYPADWKKYGRVAGPVRNREMLSKDVELVVAIGYGKGTADCMSAARDMGVLGIWRHFPGVKLDW